MSTEIRRLIADCNSADRRANLSAVVNAVDALRSGLGSVEAVEAAFRVANIRDHLPGEEGLAVDAVRDLVCETVARTTSDLARNAPA